MIIRRSILEVCSALFAVAASASLASAADVVASASEDVVAPAPSLEAPLTGLRAGDWLVRARVAALLPVDETSTVGLIGGRIVTPEMVIPDVLISYFLTDHISVEGQAGVVRTRPRIVDSAIGDLDIGTIWSAAAAASVQYHFLPEARFNPYVGVGASYSHAFSIKPGERVSDFDVKPQVSLIVQAGADYQISQNWFANAAAKYMLVPETVYEGGGATFTSDADMVFVGAGIGYRF
ncbi:OmpW/AlkL family protein [Aureimonas pseudogalii]|uniref:Outer membrane protein n=1 Tax=Aureimonas pseudogalii TaxID=1744844 RepID=A0A7W6H6P0_9HYPH|nr:OmpW family outer membrane protein [Aureimonas pseudogalii]MBB3999558.1 outer membrane protein [Aureimonas pseudogalii]